MCRHPHPECDVSWTKNCVCFVAEHGCYKLAGLPLQVLSLLGWTVDFSVWPNNLFVERVKSCFFLLCVFSCGNSFAHADFWVKFHVNPRQGGRIGLHGFSAHCWRWAIWRNRHFSLLSDKRQLPSTWNLVGKVRLLLMKVWMSCNGSAAICCDFLLAQLFIFVLSRSLGPCLPALVFMIRTDISDCHFQQVGDSSLKILTCYQYLHFSYARFLEKSMGIYSFFYGTLAQELKNAEHCTSVKTVQLTESHVIVGFLINSFREWCTTGKKNIVDILSSPRLLASTSEGESSSSEREGVRWLVLAGAPTSAEESNWCAIGGNKVADAG